MSCPYGADGLREDLNSAMIEKLGELNERVVREQGMSRREIFELWDRPEFKAPADRQRTGHMEEGPGQPRLPHRSRQALLLRPVHPSAQDRGRQVHRQHGGGLPRERARGLASKEPRSAQAYDAASAHARDTPGGGELLGR